MMGSGKKKRVDRSILKKLLRREISSKGSAFVGNSSSERFKNIGFKACFDTHDPDASKAKLPFMLKRSRVVEIVSAKEMIFGLTYAGVCVAFDRDTNRRICFLNVTSDEVIRSLFYNKTNCSLITVSVYRSDNFSSLKCRSTPIEYIRRGQPDEGFALFESEALRWPGFVEFDDVNGKVLTYSAADKIYKVWDLTNYNLLYSIVDKNIYEIKISPGVMLLIYNRTASHVPLKVLSIDTGEVLTEFQHFLHRNRKVDFIEQFNEKILVKQENEDLQIIDARDLSVTTVSKQHFLTPSAFIFLYENQMFLTFRNRHVAVWNFRGELVTRFDDHLLWHPDCNTNNIYITSHQDLIISYCRKKEHRDDEHSNSDTAPGTINVSSVLSGRSLARIPPIAENNAPIGVITSLFYNEERGEIYTGNKNGCIHVWSN